MKKIKLMATVVGMMAAMSFNALAGQTVQVHVKSEDKLFQKVVKEIEVEEVKNKNGKFVIEYTDASGTEWRFDCPKYKNGVYEPDVIKLNYSDDSRSVSETWDYTGWTVGHSVISARCVGSFVK